MIGLYGTILHPKDRIRFKELSELERERGTERLATLEDKMNAPAPDDNNDDNGKRSSSGKTSSVRAFKLIGGLGKAPLAIKTTTDKQIQEEGPINPYKTYTEQSYIMNAGVPSGTGLMLWRPRDRVSTEGRYRSGDLTLVNNSFFSELTFFLSFFSL